MLDVAIDAAKKAGELAHKYYKSQPKIRYKADKTPVTRADLEAEKLIRRIIGRNFPNHAIVGEEFGKHDTNSKYQWVIDPIDGTRYFAHHFPYWGVLLALLENGQPIIGIANLPEMSMFAIAQKGKGAFINDEKIHVSKEKNLQNASAVNGSIKYFQQKNILNNLVELYKKAQGAHLGLGSIYAYILVASGEMEINVDPVSEIYDIAAPKLIIEEAGGKFTDFNGTDSLYSGSFVATNGLLHEQVLKLLNLG